jgi:8-oxo-dGTP diphosphatase
VSYIHTLRRKIGTDLLLAPSVTEVIRNAHGQVLFAYHVDTGVRVLPGRAIEPDERPADAVVREVWEETGLHVAAERISGVLARPDLRVTYSTATRLPTS